MIIRVCYPITKLGPYHLAIVSTILVRWWALITSA